MHLNLRTVVLLTLICITVAACDPGMTIHERQGSTSRTPSVAPEGCSLEIHAKKMRQLIGETWYDPELTVTNPGESPVAIERIELVSQGVSYKLEKWAEDRMDRTIPMRATKVFNIGFDLGKTAVYKVFKEPAIIRVQYTSGKVAKTCDVEVVGTR